MQVACGDAAAVLKVGEVPGDEVPGDEGEDGPAMKTA
jgi:hypothetical protein